VPAGGPFARQICARFASPMHDRPEKWTPAHASKPARANHLPAKGRIHAYRGEVSEAFEVPHVDRVPSGNSEPVSVGRDSELPPDDDDRVLAKDNCVFDAAARAICIFS
jgi:hypothetical protein